MHIAEGFLPPLHAAAWTAVAAPFVIHGTRAISRTIKAFWSGALSATSSASATRVLSFINCATGLASKCWFSCRYHRNRKEPVRLLPSLKGWFLMTKYSKCAARLATFG